MIIETLNKSTVFSGLKDNELKKISAYFEETSLKNNETIFSEGDSSDRLYLLSEGNVKIVKHTAMGKDIILEVMSPGDIFGGVAVLDNKPYPATAQAMKAAKIVRIRRSDLMKVMDEYPDLKLQIVRYFSDKLRDSHEMFKNIATERVEHRIVSLLLKLSEKVDVDAEGYKKINVPLTRQEISEMVGTTVETCIRTMSKLQKSGIIKTSDGSVSIKPAELQRLLDE
ncbi:cAMP receptor protein [bacterium BMS3Bbin09]|nr:cAMP receptor protein [bacterium BMS3Bbin09]